MALSPHFGRCPAFLALWMLAGCSQAAPDADPTASEDGANEASLGAVTAHLQFDVPVTTTLATTSTVSRWSLDARGGKPFHVRAKTSGAGVTVTLSRGVTTAGKSKWKRVAVETADEGVADVAYTGATDATYLVEVTVAAKNTSVEVVVGCDGAKGSCAIGGGTGSSSPTIAGCPMLPSNHILNTKIDALPVHPSSATFLAAVGTSRVHLDFGPTSDPTSSEYYGIPYNVVAGNSLAWKNVAYTSATSGPGYREMSDCAVGSAHSLVSPCVASAAPAPQLPIPASPLVEGGVVADTASSPEADHHLLVLDSDTCRLWESYHAFTGTGGAWDILSSASWDLSSNRLRPADWLSSDAAGLPILPLLLRADEASAGAIRHALRFTLPRDKVRGNYVWPARNSSGGGSSASLPSMGQLFRLKASYVIPATYSAQSKAILTALKEYGMYLADLGSAFYISGEPNAAWSAQVFDEVQMLDGSQFEAVDLSPITSQCGFDPSSGAVPAP